MQLCNAWMPLHTVCSCPLDRAGCYWRPSLQDAVTKDTLIDFLLLHKTVPRHAAPRQQLDHTVTVTGCSLTCYRRQQWPPSLWKDKELKVTRPLQRRVLPLSSQPPSLIVDSNVPPLGSAVPVIIEAENMPRNELPSVGAWVKLKVVGLAAVQVGVCSCR